MFQHPIYNSQCSYFGFTGYCPYRREREGGREKSYLNDLMYKYFDSVCVCTW